MAGRQPTVPKRYDVSVEIDGKTHHGTYYVDGKTPLVTVSNGFGHKTTQRGSMDARMLAEMMLRDLVNDQETRAKRARDAESS